MLVGQAKVVKIGEVSSVRSDRLCYVVFSVFSRLG
jgi:hypothetical protein